MDVRDSDLIHARLGRAGRGMLGAIDTAVWDLKGKLLGMPLCQLLGGARRARVPAYASLHNYSESADLADELRELVVDARRQGFRALKLKIGGRPVEEDCRYLEVARAAAGDDFDLMADANQTYEMSDAVRVGRTLEELGYAWFEEPLARTDLAGYAALRAKLDIPIAGGEGVGSADDLALILRHGAVDITQPDVVGVGGPTEARGLARLAQLAGAAPTWHVWNSPLVQVATLHVLANQESWRRHSMLPARRRSRSRPCQPDARPAADRRAGGARPTDAGRPDRAGPRRRGRPRRAGRVRARRLSGRRTPASNFRPERPFSPSAWPGTCR